ncbi:uncharacterized protein LOC116765330 [Danaus plexippus]|uniref:Pantothenate kinase 4 n=1 Tax=Danaus plexippus plexippus TaxID=278856 RepID=A0A212F069_DANPL|nr:uncharacterized protein LOC116765330 [Danaus plexippus]OWR47122.1 putative Pantothenate kinase 4 [Danaus plexippus plexippus]
MVSISELICICYFVFGLSFGQVVQITTPVDVGEKGNCTCGGFPSSTIDGTTEPLLSQAPGIGVKCDDSGDGICKSLCVALATAAEARGPEILCARLKEANELQLSAFYKICDRPWTYAGISAKGALCCENGNVKVCPSVENFTASPDKKPE